MISEAEYNAQVEYLRSLVAEYRTALEFYADPKRYLGPNQPIKSEPDKYQPEDFPYLWSVDRDNGDLARKALSPLSSQQGKSP